MRCIAEGVETFEQLRVLQELGVDAGQGWLLGRPVDRDAFCGLAAATVDVGTGGRATQPTPA
jgi:EAL domain-containing protein (putative c-di-GMP-specific phosphodiesterase class I)